MRNARWADKEKTQRKHWSKGKTGWKHWTERRYNTAKQRHEEWELRQTWRGESGIPQDNQREGIIHRISDRWIAESPASLTLAPSDSPSISAARCFCSIIKSEVRRVITDSSTPGRKSVMSHAVTSEVLQGARADLSVDLKLSRRHWQNRPSVKVHHTYTESYIHKQYSSF